MKPMVKQIFLILSGLSLLSIGCIIGRLWALQNPHVQLQDDARTHVDSFGKTHFIIGHPTQTLDETPPQKSIEPSDNTDQDIDKDKASHVCDISNLATFLTCNDGHFKKAFFSPDDNLENILVNLINQEQEAITIAVFSFTSGVVAHALLKAKERGVHIEIITDSSCLKDRFNKIELLQQKGIKILVYKPSGTTLLSDIMHNKFVIFKKNVNNKKILWTGSYNFTKSAQLKNQENVIIIDEEHIIERYIKQFDIIKIRVIASNKPKTTVAQRGKKLKRSRAYKDLAIAYEKKRIAKV